MEPVHAEPLAVDILAGARMTGVGRTRLYEEIKAGRLKTITVGRRRLIPRAAIEEWMRDRIAEAEGTL